MPIVLSRIDDRLIHGQVVEGWLRKIRVNYIIVVSDEVAGDKMQQTLLGMAAPSDVRVSSFSIEDAGTKLVSDQFSDESIMLLFSCPGDVLRLLKTGVKLSSVNVGGMHYSTGKKQILRNLSVDEDDIKVFYEIDKLGVELEGRILPNDQRKNIMEIINASLEKE